MASCRSDPAPAAPEPEPEPLDLAAALEQTSAFHATRPIYETPLGDGQQVPEGVGSLSAVVCGACHVEIYAEWKLSVHAAAWTDRQYQEEIGKSGNRWLCLNCHTPLLVQHDKWPIGLTDEDVELPILVDNPGFDPALRDEGITCAACHVREGVIHGPGLAVEGDPPSPHPVVADPGFRDGSLCERCHQATARYPGKQFICTFDTGEEWRAGPYAAEGTGCADCHMPAVERAAAVGGPTRTVGRHFWRGAGIPKEEGVHPPLEANPPGLAVLARWEGEELVLDLTNERAGHMLPTGDPERWVQVDVRFEDAKGAAVGEPWSTRIGQRWEWSPEPRKLGDNRLKPRETRTERVSAPGEAVRAVIEAANHRITVETAAYHHLDGYPRFVTFFSEVVSR